MDWLHTAKLGFRNGLEASVGKSFVRHLRAVFYELTTDRIDRLKLRGCVVPELFAPLLKAEYNNPAKQGHQRLPPLSKVMQMLCFDVRFFFQMYTMHELLCYVQFYTPLMSFFLLFCNFLFFSTSRI